MVIRLDENYNAMTSTALLGYVGETNARPVSVEGMEIDGADRYVLTIDYGDGTVYEVDITGGTWTPTADILRSAQTVSCQIVAKKLSGDEYILVKKSRIFHLRIGAAIGNNAVPSPDVAVDALDRIDAIGRQAHADMQTAVTAAETATTAAENAEKSATTAGVSADTATQAAERAETAKTSAETSATQAETARQGAETARAEAVKSQNSAKVSAVQASTAAQQTEADKIITAGYAKTAKTCADSTAADKQAVQTLAEQVTADKAIVAENAAKVAEDRTAAETAAQTAQAVADSLPDDYVTAVAKIAENTSEISAVKLTDKEMKRRVDALYDLGNGVTHQFETDSDTAYAKTVPTGAKLMSVKSVGGRSIVFNQMVDLSKSKETTADGVTFTFSGDGIVALNGTSNKEGNSIAVAVIKNMKDHKYLIIASPLSNVYGVGQLLFTSQVYGADTTGHGAIIVNGSSNATWYYTLYLYNGITYDNVKLQPQIFDLTAMFGSGNEPASVEEFEKMFPADYYPYAVGEIVSAGTEEVVVGDTAHPIPEAIRNLPGYGWSAGTARNYVDYENKKYVQCVNSVDLGTLNLIQVKGRFTVDVSDSLDKLIKKPKDPETTINIVCSHFTAVSYAAPWVDHIVSCHISEGQKRILFIDSAYTDAETFKQAMQGVMLYYELETPIVTDISTMLPDDFLRNLTVEAGGSITFKGGNDSYRIPVPSEEEYIVKLSEVGGSV